MSTLQSSDLSEPTVSGNGVRKAMSDMQKIKLQQELIENYQEQIDLLEKLIKLQEEE